MVSASSVPSSIVFVTDSQSVQDICELGVGRLRAPISHLRIIHATLRLYVYLTCLLRLPCTCPVYSKRVFLFTTTYLITRLPCPTCNYCPILGSGHLPDSVSLGTEGYYVRIADWKGKGGFRPRLLCPACLGPLLAHSLRLIRFLFYPTRSIRRSYGLRSKQRWLAKIVALDELPPGIRLGGWEFQRGYSRSSPGRHFPHFERSLY